MTLLPRVSYASREAMDGEVAERCPLAKRELLKHGTAGVIWLRLSPCYDTGKGGRVSLGLATQPLGFVAAGAGTMRKVFGTTASA